MVDLATTKLPNYQTTQLAMNFFDELENNLANEILCAVATIIDGPNIGAKMIVYPDGRASGDLGNARIITDAQRAMQTEQSENCAYGDTQVFIDVFAPKPKLIVFGGVHTAIPLTQFAQALGFFVTVIDGRSRFASRERFPTADRILVEWPQDALKQIKIDSSTYVAILTHDPKFDIPALLALSQTTPPRYIGAIGSRETRRQHFAELRSLGVSEEFLARVHGPIGLDLGARTPEQVAIAILAEILAVRYARSGGFLSQVEK